MSFVSKKENISYEKSIVKSAVFALALALLFFVQITGANWLKPAGNPTSNNTEPPLNTGTTDQVKDAGISVNALAVFGDEYVEGNLGIDEVNPLHLLDLGGVPGIDGIRFPDGTVQTSAATVGTGLLSVNNTLHVQDQKPGGTNGGTFTSGAERTRTLNTVVRNTISGASLSSNRITLPAGRYYIYAAAPAGSVSRHRAKLRNITDNLDIIIGTSEYADQGSGDGQSRSVITGVFAIDATKTFEIQHRSDRTFSGTGFGYGNAWIITIPEIYTDVKIWKI